MEPKDVIVFEESVRRTWINDELWFAAKDVIAAMAKKEPAAEKEYPEVKKEAERAE